MKRELFTLKRFKLKENQDIELSYKYNGKMYEKVTWSEPVHPDLSDKFNRLEGVFTIITGIIADAENAAAKVLSIDVRGVYSFEGAENKSFMISAVVEFQGGVKVNINTPKYSTTMYAELFIKETNDLNMEAYLKDLENEVFELVNNHKSAQGTLFSQEEQGAEQEQE